MAAFSLLKKLQRESYQMGAHEFTRVHCGGNLEFTREITEGVY
jgi:hypothetical protein